MHKKTLKPRLVGLKKSAYLSVHTRVFRLNELWVPFFVFASSSAAAGGAAAAVGTTMGQEPQQQRESCGDSNSLPLVILIHHVSLCLPRYDVYLHYKKPPLKHHH